MHKSKNISINKGFSKISLEYESLDKTSSLIRWMRNRVRSHFENYLSSNNSILEINCGSGIDAVYFAKMGHNVHAIDLAHGMIDLVTSKINNENLASKLSCEVLSYEDLDKLSHKKYSHIFSNFGGLNCSSLEELENVFKLFNTILNPNGIITLVIMPKLCLWEFLRIFKGQKHAFRRLKKNGVMTNIAGESVQVYYHSVNKIKNLLKPNFTNFNIENISFIGPTGNLVDFPKKHPFIFKYLSKLDSVSSKLPFLKGIGDYYIISAKKN
jgi:ubiquinone/menaquinone biosynthesis C-methylase UbiE